jgi:hypothetical protein
MSRHRSRRRSFAFPVLVAASLAACVASIGMWLRSCGVADAWDWDTRSGRCSIGSAAGGVFFDRADDSDGPNSHVHSSRGPGYHAVSVSGPGPTIVPPSWNFAGFQWTHTVIGTTEFLDVRVPYWAIVLISAGPPAAWVWVRSRRRADRGGLCPVCGYDLRATPDRCPECGEPVASSNSKEAA